MGVPTRPMMIPASAGPAIRARLKMALLSAIRVRHVGRPDHLGHEGLPGRVVHDRYHAQRESQQVDVPQPDRSGNREEAENQRQAAHEALGDQQNAALAEPVGDRAAPQAEQQQREELQARSDAERRAAAVRQVQHQPVLRGPLHPRAAVGDDLPGREQAVIMVAQGAEHPPAVAGRIGAGRRGRGTGRGRPPQDWLSFSRIGAAARSVARSCGVSSLSRFASHSSRRRRARRTTARPSAVTVRTTWRRSVV